MGWIVLGIISLVVIGLITGYNTLVSLKKRVENAWSQIDVQLKRRYDLIPNLIEVAKGYLAHERNVLENVTKARNQAISAEGVKAQAEAENFLTQSLRSLFAVVENYPDLKANQNMLTLHEELTSTENKIAFARQYYNDEVMRLNTTINSFPTNLIANWFRFSPSEFFEIEDLSHREAPKVKF
ncbi:MAG: LemA family protein [bacterium]